MITIPFTCKRCGSPSEKNPKAYSQKYCDTCRPIAAKEWHAKYAKDNREKFRTANRKKLPTQRQEVEGYEISLAAG